MRTLYENCTNFLRTIRTLSSIPTKFVIFFSLLALPYHFAQFWQQKHQCRIMVFQYIKEFGTNHIYNADLFNEMPPPSNDTDYLHSCSQKVFETITSVDPEGIWMIQGWMFFHDPINWEPPQAKAFLTAVPLGRMLVLDLQSELYPQYPRLSSYFGQPFIWCMLHNYGGVTGLYGSLEQINMGPFEARFFDNSTMVGTGLTPEGIETNDVVYELMNEMAWRKRPVDLDKWIYDYIFRRYGTVSYSNLYAWLLLRRSVYNATVPYRNHGKYILIRRPSLKLKPYIWYDPQDVFNAWKHFLNASQEGALYYSLLYRHDLVDVTRQALQLIMDNFYIKLKNSFRNKDLQVFETYATLIVQLFQDMDKILATDKQFLLGKWLEDAKSLATTPIEAAQYEYNARNQITLWGPTGQILDYANKQWTGLMLNYYGKRWELFVNFLDDALRKQRPFNQSDFNAEVFRRVEEPFTLGLERYRNYTIGDSIEISQELLRKYENFTSRV